MTGYDKVRQRATDGVTGVSDNYGSGQCSPKAVLLQVAIVLVVDALVTVAGGRKDVVLAPKEKSSSLSIRWQKEEEEARV